MNLSTLVQINTIQSSNSEAEEAKRRTNAEAISYYAESGQTYDPSGKYLCGTCKARVGKNKCAWVEGNISMQTGSCMLYMIGEPTEKELPKKMSQTDSKYTERPNIKAFGCTRCEYGKKVSPDSSGRNYYCSFWKMHVMATACCMMNEGKDDVFAPADNGEVNAGGPGSGRHKGEKMINQLIANNHVHADGSWTHNSKQTWSGHRGTLPRTLGEGFGSEELDKYLSRNIQAGGSGSGCHGPNCGRPGSRSKAQQTSGPRWHQMTHEQRMQYVKEHTQVGNKVEQTPKPKAEATNEKIYPHSGKGAMGVGRPANVKPEERLGKVTGPKGNTPAQRNEKLAAPIYKKSFDEEDVKKEKQLQEGMRQWKENLPPTGDKGTHNLITEGALVKNNVPIKAFDNDKLEYKNYKPGTILTVQNVLPSIGNNPRMVSVKFPQGDIIHVPENQLDFHKTAESQKEKPAYEIRREIGLDKSTPRPGKIAQETQTGTGAKYYKLKPETAGRPAGSGNFMKKPTEWSKGQPQPAEHPLKGQFSLAKGPHGKTMSDIFTLDLNLKSFGQGTAKATVFDANKKDGSGSTVIVWRDTTNKTGKVMEFDRDQHGYVKLGSAPAVKFNNVGHMSSYLSKRYDISLKLPGDSVAKKGRRK